MAADFDTFLKGPRQEAASAFVRGDPSLVLAMSADTGQATFFDPGGGFTEGAANVNRANAEGAARFGPRGTTELQIKDRGASGDLAFWTGFQTAQVESDGKITPMTIRVTEVYRLQQGEWKMVHRHASPAKEEPHP